MRNIIRADLYRIVRGKGLYITLAVLLLIIAMQIAGGLQMNTGVTDMYIYTEDGLEFVNPFELAEEDLTFDSIIHQVTGKEVPSHFMGSTANLLYFLLPLIIFIGAVDFSSGAVKNTLSGGVSRVKYYFSKLIMACVWCVLLLVFYVFTAMLVATLVNGFGGTLDGEFVSYFAKVFFMQLWLCLACTCVANFILFAFRKSSGVIGGNIAFFFGPSLIFLLLAQIHDWFENLFFYDLNMSIGLMPQVNLMPAGDVLRSVLVGAGYITVAIAGGYALFKKAEIK
ncbi:MAG: ABC transporter permease [Oscillospiraceae bacterium]|nr:ABC transporter permease [Oscillospiraceae bacterium]